MGFSQILTDIGLFLLVTAAAFVLLCLLTSYLRFQNMAERAASLDCQDGMDARNVFQLKIAHLLGTAHRIPDPFTVALVGIDRFEALAARHGADTAEEVMSCLEKQLKDSLRAGDTVMRYDNARFGLIVETARTNASNVVHRLLATVAREQCHCASGLVLPVTISAGIATHPENGDRVKLLIDSASASLTSAAARGEGCCDLAGPEESDKAPERTATADEPQQAPATNKLIDPLTGVLRAERLGSVMHKFVARNRDDKGAVSMLLLDVDHLGRYNEHYGRQTGDELLRSLCELLERNVREPDLLGRLGEDDFIILMGCKPQDALAAGHRLVALVKKTAFQAGGNNLRITVSMGVAGYPDHGKNARHLLEGAEAALVSAKQKGRNMCLMFEQAMHIPESGAQQVDTF